MRICIALNEADFIHAKIGRRKMHQILKVGEDFVTREVDQMSEPELQVPDISRDPERIRQHMRRLMEEEELRVAEEEQPIVNTINMVCLIVCSMMVGMLLMMIK